VSNKAVLLGVVLATPVTLEGLFLVVLSPVISKLGGIIQFLFALTANIFLWKFFLVYFQQLWTLETHFADTAMSRTDNWRTIEYFTEFSYLIGFFRINAVGRIAKYLPK
jgi:hypothetical protein